MSKTLISIALLLACIVALVAASRSIEQSVVASASAPISEYGVGALGRIEPQSRVIKVNAPSTMEPPVVEKLHVDVGDEVTEGQTLAVLDSNRRELADVEEARASLLVAEKSLAQIQAGAKAGDIVAQEAMVERTRERLKLAEKKLDRIRRMVQSKVMSDDDLDVGIADVEVLQRELRQHEATLVALNEVRTVDVEYALAEVARARAELQRADADLEISVIRSPIAGSILRINSRGGERIGTDGLLELGDTREMDVVAEVHESDILRVKVDMPATIFLRNLDRTLHGHVIEIGGLVGRKDVLSDDPVDDTDARIVEVRIRLDAEDGQLVARMSYARVEVTIDTRTNSSPISGQTTELSQNGSAR
ncbi:MAG: HlyD family efflux transporter periplasmic adaptor subunit [Fuerstia sp.]|nr:HlyD family efflux transporter periplasmic adaptor subunit [Fuerstiella sp.]